MILFSNFIFLLQTTKILSSANLDEITLNSLNIYTGQTTYRQFFFGTYNPTLGEDIVLARNVTAGQELFTTTATNVEIDDFNLTFKQTNQTQ